MNNSLNDKIIHAQNVLHVAVKLANTYYKKPIAICYSGGKDSDVLLDIQHTKAKEHHFGNFASKGRYYQRG